LQLTHVTNDLSAICTKAISARIKPEDEEEEVEAEEQNAGCTCLCGEGWPKHALAKQWVGVLFPYRAASQS